MNLQAVSIQVIKHNQSSSGGYTASPTFSQYGYSWLRDGMWIAHSMDCVGEHGSATAFHRWAGRTILHYTDKINQLLVKHRQGQPLTDPDYLPTRFHLDGTLGNEDWPDFQLDGYGAWLWGAVAHCKNVNPALWQELRPAVALLVRYLEVLWQSPSYDCWEEFRYEVHLSTLAALYGGLCAVYTHDPNLVPADLPEKIRAYALEHGVAREGHWMKFLGNENVDASLLWTALPFGLVALDDPVFEKTLQKIERDLVAPDGGVYRYRQDTYFGGGEWLLLTCWRAWAHFATGRIAEAQAILQWVEAQATPSGEMPEQVAHHLLDPSMFQGWVDKWGESALPLLWSHAMYLIVKTELEKVIA